ncbi:MAG: hypothetical protein P4L51_26840 [Puia sp.]|nr:hypothetical protein [Puia sp.]
MQINWFTVIAQMINFFILVWLLKRFLYKPVLKAIDDREKRIAAQLQDAAAKEAAAKQQGDEYRLKQEAFDRDRASLLQKAVDEGNAERRRLMETARKESGDLRAALERSLEQEKENTNREIVRMTQNEVFAIAKKTLEDLASSGLEEQSVRIFIRRLRSLDGTGKQAFLAAFGAETHSLTVKSAFDLSGSLRQEIETAVRDLLTAPPAIPGTAAPAFVYETAPQLVSGIELAAGGYKLGWNIEAYLASMEKQLKEINPNQVTEPEKKINGNKETNPVNNKETAPSNG